MQSAISDEQSVSLSTLRRIRWAMRAALALGIAASVSANVLHAQPNDIARVIAAWPPVALLVAVETLGRAPIRKRLNWVRMAAVGAIATIAAWVSYWHMAGVAARYGEDLGSAHLLPLSVDGLILMTSVTLVDLTARVRSMRAAADEAAGVATNAQPGAAASPQVSLVKRRHQSAADPVTTEPVPESPEQLRARGLAEVVAGTWTVEQAATHAGISVRRFQQWADEAATKTRRPRGGARKPLTEPTEPANGVEVPQLVSRTTDA